MQKLSATITILIFIFSCMPVYSSNKQLTNTRLYDSDKLRIKLSSRTPQQMAAFYEARGFNKPMLDKIRQYCFITVYIKNKSNNIIWLDLKQWEFRHGDKDIIRIDRDQFKQQWQDMAIPLSHQSTFRWTLLPEQLDFRPNEREGGNIVLPWTNTPVSIQARFDSLGDRSGRPITLKLENILCKEQSK